MNEEEITKLVSEKVQDVTVEVQLNGNHANLVVVSPSFQDLTSVKRQQLVYSALTSLISSGTLHAVNMETFTPQEWQKAAPFRGA